MISHLTPSPTPCDRPLYWAERVLYCSCMLQVSLRLVSSSLCLTSVEAQGAQTNLRLTCSIRIPLPFCRTTLGFLHPQSPSAVARPLPFPRNTLCMTSKSRRSLERQDLDRLPTHVRQEGSSLNSR